MRYPKAGEPIYRTRRDPVTGATITIRSSWSDGTRHNWFAELTSDDDPSVPHSGYGK